MLYDIRERLMKNKKSTIILLVSFFVGLSVLLYPAISSYWNSKTQSEVILDYEAMLANIEADDYMVYISGNRIFVEGTSEGEEISLYSSNGMLLQKIKSQTNITILETIAQGVLVVKVEDKVYKVVKK